MMSLAVIHILFSLAIITTNLRTIQTSTNATLCSTNPGSLCVKISDCDSRDKLHHNYCGLEDGVSKVCCQKSRNTPTCGIPAIKTSPESNKQTWRLTGQTRKAVLGSWPWMAALYYDDPQEFCSGVLISPEWILTTFECTYIGKLSYVRLGDLDIDENVSDGATPIEMNVTQIITHRDYPHGQYDIALLRLSKPVEYTEHIRPICVRGRDEKYLNESYFAQKKAVMIGWPRIEPVKVGVRTRFLENTHLLEVTMDVVPSDASCSEYIALEKRLRNGNMIICYNISKSGDSLEGAYGGPLMFQDNDVWWVGGMFVNGGNSRNISHFVGWYTQVPLYFDWIETSTGLKF